MQCVYVDRLSQKRGNATALVGERQRKLAAGEAISPIMLFPEGTTTNNIFLLPFKTGVFVAGLPVQPVVIREDTIQTKGERSSLHAATKLSSHEKREAFFPFFPPAEHHSTILLKRRLLLSPFLASVRIDSNCALSYDASVAAGKLRRI